ncbi:MAG: PP2C family protein-serine/threonine phosphatase [Phycisphaerales bacterium]
MTTARSEIPTDRIDALSDLMRGLTSAKSPQESSFTFGMASRRFFPSDGFMSVSRRGLPDGEYKITREYLSGRLPQSPSESNPWRDWATLATHRGGFIGEIIAAGVPRRFNDLRITGDPVLGDKLANFRSAVILPVFDDGQALNWSFSFRREAQEVSDEQFEMALLVMNLHGRATKNLVALQQVEELNARLNQQLERVAAIQRSLLPDRTPDIPGLELATSYLTSDEAGGDYYDFLPLEGGKWGVFIGDVSGHGAGAATVMAMVHAILRTYPEREHDPAGVMAYLNRHLSEKRIESNFVTAFYGVLEPDTRRFTFANAGHHPPRRKCRGSGEVATLDGARAVPLGIFDELEIEPTEVTLSSDETIVFFTDGITEARDASGAMFGEAGLDASLRLCSGEAECIIDSVHGALFEHTQRRTRDDDQTLIAMQVR